MPTDRPAQPPADPADAGFWSELRRRAALGGFLLAVALAAVPLTRLFNGAPSPAPGVSASAPHDAPAGASRARRVPVIADFGSEPASREARVVAGWSLFTGDNKERPVVIIDKREAKVFVFSPTGELLGAAPALLGLAHGDDTVPGIGERPIADVRPEERTTPAGRFVAEPGVNAGGEDVVWVDYDAAVSMHRVRPLVKAERRLERLASATPEDNRISYGCINLPPAFYENVVSRAARAGAVIYVLPENGTPEQLFGAWYFEGATLAKR
ncbi:MAG TPA: hypothetical protein VLJ86_20885 [Ramlibacter sp.]|nr:hypothetical protein [Ramlibacter sp.]